MKIEKIDATLHRHEIDLPGIGKSIESRMFVFVEVTTDEGQTGFGLTGFPVSSRPALIVRRW